MKNESERVGVDLFGAPMVSLSLTRALATARAVVRYFMVSSDQLKLIDESRGISPSVLFYEYYFYFI